MKMKYSTLFVSVILLTGFTAAQTSTGQNSQLKAGLTPASPFYGVEQFVEKIEVAVAKAPVVGSEELEAKVRANNAAERLSEAEKMSETGRNNSKKVEKLFQEYDRQMEISSSLANKSGKKELSGKIKEVQDRQIQQLGQLREKLPEESRKGIDKAIEKAEKRRDRGKNPDRDNRLPENRETRDQLELRPNLSSEKSEESRDRAEEVRNLSPRNESEPADSLEDRVTENDSPEKQETEQNMDEAVENTSTDKNQLTGKATSAPFR